VSSLRSGAYPEKIEGSLSGHDERSPKNVFSRFFALVSWFDKLTTWRFEGLTASLGLENDRGWALASAKAQTSFTGKVTTAQGPHIYPPPHAGEE
jgi:hypothetical protein